VMIEKGQLMKTAITVFLFILCSNPSRID